MPLKQMDIYECIAIAKERNNKMAKKVSTPTPEDPEKVSQRNARLQIFRAGFLSGVAYGRSPKYKPTDPNCLKDAVEACERMFSLSEEDATMRENGEGEIESIARILGLVDDKK